MRTKFHSDNMKASGIAFCLLFACSLFSQTFGFLPNRLSAIAQDDFTKEDITRGGILRALDLLEDKDNFTTTADSSFEAALQTIMTGSNMADVYHHDDPSWHFNNEQIMTGHERLISLYARLLQILTVDQTEARVDTVDWLAARETLGECLHLLQTFYSNTNWVEARGDRIYNALGKFGERLMPVAPRNIDTCTSCGYITSPDCVDNVINKEFLTSGYTRSPDINTLPASFWSGKCRHGGKRNVISDEDLLVPGGINKESRDRKFSPHFYLHDQAAELAIQHTEKFLRDLREDLSKYGTDVIFQKLFGLREMAMGTKVTIVLNLADSAQRNVTDETIQQLNLNDVQPDRILCLQGIFEDTPCFQKDNHVIIITDKSPESIHFPEIWTKRCLEVPLHEAGRYSVIQVQEKNRMMKLISKGRYKRAGGLDLYHIIADTSGGTVYETSKSSIGAVVDIIKETVKSIPPVTVRKFKMAASASSETTIPVDDQIKNLTIKVQGRTSPDMDLIKPDKSLASFTGGITKQKLGTRLVVIRLKAPIHGTWTLKRKGGGEWDVDVTGSSTLDFTFKLMQPGPGGFGEYPLTGRPIAGINTTIQIKVSQYDQVASIDNVFLLDRAGKQTGTVPLFNVGGRRGKSLFKGHIVIPANEFKIAIDGKDKTGNNFRRLDPVIISTLAIKLEVLSLSGTLYINKEVTIPFRVTNVGGGTTKILVSISDDKNFAKAPIQHTYTLTSKQNGTGQFVLHAGSRKGETTTVTISAKADGAPSNQVQYSVQRITVEEKIVRAEDKIPPTCNITSSTGKCDFAKDPCACSNGTWQMTAVIGDVGFGLQSVFASGAGNNSHFTSDPFSMGLTTSKGTITASLGADCCHQHAKITVVDLAGNVGLCDVTINPGFTPPDPKLCIKPSKVTVTPKANATQISCKVTGITGSCDLSNFSCTGSSCNGTQLCERRFWNMKALLGNEGFGKYQALPLDSGVNSNFTFNNRSVQLSMDCCHPSVYVRVIDIARNEGQCHANITVVYKTTTQPTNSTKPKHSPSSPSLPVAAVAGGAAGGIAVIGGAVALGVFLKKKFGASASTNTVSPDPTEDTVITNVPPATTATNVN